VFGAAIDYDSLTVLLAVFMLQPMRARFPRRASVVQ